MINVKNIINYDAESFVKNDYNTTSDTKDEDVVFNKLNRISNRYRFLFSVFAALTSMSWGVFLGTLARCFLQGELHLITAISFILAVAFTPVTILMYRLFVKSSDNLISHSVNTGSIQLSHGKYHEIVNGNKKLACYILSITENKYCRVRVIVETPNSMILEESFYCHYASTADVQEPTLDVENDTVYIPLNFNDREKQL